MLVAPAQQNRLAPIDGLRGVAILMVTSVHLWSAAGRHQWAGPINWAVPITFGMMGTSLFFVISGFCLYLPLVSRTLRGQSWPTWANFYSRRALRIIPAYYVAMAAWLVFRDYAAKTGGVSPLAHLLTHLTFTHGMHPATYESIAGIFWTLSTEAQFYLVFPVLALVLTRRPFATWFTAYGVGLGLQWFITASGAISYPGPLGIMLERSFPARLGEFLSGMMVAHVIATRPQVRHYALPVGAVSVACLLAAPWLHFRMLGGHWYWPDIFFALPWAGLVFAAGVNQNLMARIAAFPALVGAGVISYSTYLAQPIIYHGVGLPQGAVLALVAGALGYHLIEKPFLGLRARLRAQTSEQRARNIEEVGGLVHAELR